MEQKKENKMNFSVEEAMQLAQSDAAQQLIALLQQQNAQALQQAAGLASSGQLAQAGQIMSSLLTDPKAAALMKKLKE